jgi:hypothetical protein
MALLTILAIDFILFKNYKVVTVKNFIIANVVVVPYYYLFSNYYCL